MGFGLGNVLGGGLGAGLGPVGSIVGGTLGLGGIKDLLLGKKSEGVAGGYSQLDPSQIAAKNIYDEQLANIKNFDPENLASIQVANQERGLRAGAEDAARHAQDLINQRGLGKSSVGLNAILGTRQNLNDQILATRAQAPLLQQQFEDQKANRLGSLSGGINNILNSRFYTQPQAGGVRQGGLLSPLLGIGGAALGAKYGGPMGSVAVDFATHAPFTEA